MRLVQQAGLTCGGLGRKRDHNRVSHRLKPRAHRPDKVGVSRGVLGRDVLKVDVHARKALRGKRLRKVFDQCAARRRIAQQLLRPCAGKLAVLAQCGQHQQRPHAILPRYARDRFRILRQQTAKTVKTIGENR